MPRFSAEVNPVGITAIPRLSIQCDGHELLNDISQWSSLRAMSNMWSYRAGIGNFRHNHAGEGVLLRLSFGFLDSFQPFPVLFTDLQRQSMLWVSSMRRVRMERVMGRRPTVVPAGWGGSTPGRWRHPVGCWWWWRGKPWRGQLDPPAGSPDTTYSPRWGAELSLWMSAFWGGWEGRHMVYSEQQNQGHFHLCS